MSTYNPAIKSPDPPSTVCGDKCPLLKGSWDLATKVVSKVTILINTSNPN